MESTEDTEPEERWYWVKATYKAVHLGVRKKKHLWQRVIFLIRAPNTDLLSLPQKALRKAEEIARTKEHQYEAVCGDTVRWEFQQIEEVKPLLDDEFIDGVEVYFEFFHRIDKTV